RGEKAIDLMDRTAGHTDWMVIRPAVTEASNCIFPVYVVQITGGGGQTDGTTSFCDYAYVAGEDPVTQQAPQYDSNGHLIPPGFAYTGMAVPNYPGFDPASAPNNGQGFDKDLSHNEMPNAPPFTVSFGAQYSMPVTPDWAATLRGDFYWQDASYWRVFNDLSYDKLHAYSN